MRRLCAFKRKHTAETEHIRVHGISERKECVNDPRQISGERN